MGLARAKARFCFFEGEWCESKVQDKDEGGIYVTLLLRVFTTCRMRFTRE